MKYWFLATGLLFLIMSCFSEKHDDAETILAFIQMGVAAILIRIDDRHEEK